MTFPAPTLQPTRRIPRALRLLALLALATSAAGCRDFPADPDSPLRLSVKGTIRYTNTLPGIRLGDPVPRATVGLLTEGDWHTPLFTATANALGEYEMELPTTHGECERLILMATLDTWGHSGYSTEQSRELSCGSGRQRIDLKFTIHEF